MAFSYFLLLNPNQCLPFKKVSRSFSCVQLFVTPWTVAHQAPLSMGFSRQEYWGGFPDPGIEPRSPVLQADALTSEPPGKPIGYLVTLYPIRESRIKNQGAHL